MPGCDLVSLTSVSHFQHAACCVLRAACCQTPLPRAGLGQHRPIWHRHHSALAQTLHSEGHTSKNKNVKLGPKPERFLCKTELGCACCLSLLVPTLLPPPPPSPLRLGNMLPKRPLARVASSEHPRPVEAMLQGAPCNTRGRLVGEPNPVPCNDVCKFIPDWPRAWTLASRKRAPIAPAHLIRAHKNSRWP